MKKTCATVFLECLKGSNFPIINQIYRLFSKVWAFCPNILCKFPKIKLRNVAPNYQTSLTENELWISIRNSPCSQTAPDPAITLQRNSTEISKQIFPEKEYRGLSPSFHIHVSVSDLYISTMGLFILLEEICGLILGLYKSLKDTWMWKLWLRPRYSQKRNT